MHDPMRIGLVSQSAGRQELLRDAGVRFEAIAADINEDIRAMEPPLLVTTLAMSKARAGKGVIEAEVLVGADSVVLLDAEVIGKPASRVEAIEMLSRLQGRGHDLLSGVAVIRTDNLEEASGFRSTSVRMRSMSRDEIESYVDHFQPYYLAGGYEMDGIASIFIESIDGCPTNVIGMSMALLRNLINQIGYSWFQFLG